MAKEVKEEEQATPASAAPGGVWLAQRVRPIQFPIAKASKRLRVPWKALATVIIVTGVVLALVFGVVKLAKHPHKPNIVPSNISHAVNFSVYYPQQSRLPSGYTFSTSSFTTPVQNGVSYWVNYGNGQRIVFSLQPRPSDSELQTFNANYIPVKIDYKAPLGQAELGTYHSQTLVSLPISNGPWIIVTAPSDVNQSDLKAILSSLTKD